MNRLPNPGEENLARVIINAPGAKVTVSRTTDPMGPSAEELKQAAAALQPSQGMNEQIQQVLNHEGGAQQEECSIEPVDSPWAALAPVQFKAEDLPSSYRAGNSSKPRDPSRSEPTIQMAVPHNLGFREKEEGKTKPPSPNAKLRMLVGSMTVAVAAATVGVIGYLKATEKTDNVDPTSVTSAQDPNLKREPASVIPTAAPAATAVATSTPTAPPTAEPSAENVPDQVPSQIVTAQLTSVPTAPASVPKVNKPQQPKKKDSLIMRDAPF